MVPGFQEIHQQPTPTRSQPVASLKAISPQKPVRFTDVTYEAQIRSGEDDGRVRELARMAAEDCYVTNTLRRSCNVNGIIFHNGKKIDEHH
jgi:hypothetical protein